MQPGIIRQNGFVWLALARENVLPLTLLEKTDGNFFQRLFGGPKEADALNATIFSLFPKKGKGKLPIISEPGNAAFFKGFDLLDLKSEAKAHSTKEIPLLGKSEASAKLATASKLLYSFEDVTHRGVETEVLLEEHLNVTKPVADAHGFLDKLAKGNLYVVIDVLQTPKFSVRDVSEFSFSGDLTAEAIQQAVELSARFQAQAEKEKELSFEGKAPVTFALKAFRILFNSKSGHYTLSKKKINIVKGASSIEPDDLSSEDIIELA